MLANISVREYMTTKPLVFSPDLDVFEAIRQLISHKITGAPVVEKGKLLGVFSEFDCMKATVEACYHEGMPGKIRDNMTTDFKPIGADTSILEAAEIFSKSPLRNLPVVDGGQLIGVISRVDILKAAMKIW
jgi:CBS domain-containing protein